jgi:hypothetical protein
MAVQAWIEEAHAARLDATSGGRPHPVAALAHPVPAVEAGYDLTRGAV